jgi:predicted signal transduction protein with EAL and GGDEF domain
MDVVARYAADEFLIHAADLEPESPAARAGPDAGGAAQTHELASAVHAAFERPFELDGNEVYVDAAVGISLFPLDADNATVLLRHADQAAAQAKRPGEGPTHQFAEETSDKWGRLWLATRLRKAIEHDELRLHYQPIVSLGSLRLTARLPRISRVTSSLRRRSCAGRTATASFLRRASSRWPRTSD